MDAVSEHAEEEDMTSADAAAENGINIGPFTNQQGVKFTADSAAKGTFRTLCFLFYCEPNQFQF